MTNSHNWNVSPEHKLDQGDAFTANGRTDGEQGSNVPQLCKTDTAPEQPELTEQKRTIGRTRVGTARPKALDLFCCAGGASMGLYRAGFDVTGVDIRPQPRYPFRFVQADALNPPFDLAEFDFIWASPPCQFATLLKHAPGGKEHPNLIPPTRALLDRAGVLYVIENVEPAARYLINPVTLCGTMFGLSAQGCELRRHRSFETSFPFRAPACRHGDGAVIGVYGGHARRRSARHGGRGTRDKWTGGHKPAAAEALGITWASLGEMSEAIPPAYAEYIGRAALESMAATPFPRRSR